MKTVLITGAGDVCTHLAREPAEHQSLETVAQTREIVHARAPKGSVNAEHWTRKSRIGR